MTDASATATEPPRTRPLDRTRRASRASSPARRASAYVDGERGRLLYRGYRIGDLVEHGTYPAVANLLWTGEWDPDASTADRHRSRRRS